MEQDLKATPSTNPACRSARRNEHLGLWQWGNGGDEEALSVHSAVVQGGLHCAHGEVWGIVSHTCCLKLSQTASAPTGIAEAKVNKSLWRNLHLPQTSRNFHIMRFSGKQAVPSQKITNAQGNKVPWTTTCRNNRQALVRLIRAPREARVLDGEDETGVKWK